MDCSKPFGPPYTTQLYTLHDHNTQPREETWEEYYANNTSVHTYSSHSLYLQSPRSYRDQFEQQLPPSLSNNVRNPYQVYPTPAPGLAYSHSYSPSLPTSAADDAWSLEGTFETWTPNDEDLAAEAKFGASGGSHSIPLPNTKLNGGVPSRQRNQQRPPPICAPPCTFDVQNRFCVKGTLFDTKFVCGWAGCFFSSFQGWFPNFESFVDHICKHIVEHAEQLGKDNRCRWLNCRSGPLQGSLCTRNRARHITTHMAWYFLCPRCATLGARLDAPNNLCPRECGLQDPEVRHRLLFAQQTLGEHLTMAYVWEHVLGHSPAGYHTFPPNGKHGEEARREEVRHRLQGN